MHVCICVCVCACTSVCIERKTQTDRQIYFKVLVPVIVGAGKSEFCRSDQQAQGRVEIAEQVSLAAEFILPPGTFCFTQHLLI